MGGFFAFIFCLFPSAEKADGSYFISFHISLMNVSALSPLLAIRNVTFKSNYLHNGLLEGISALTLLLAPFFTIISFITILISTKNGYHLTDFFYVQFSLLFFNNGFSFYHMFIKKKIPQPNENQTIDEDIS